MQFIDPITIDHLGRTLHAGDLYILFGATMLTGALLAIILFVRKEKSDWMMSHQELAILFDEYRLHRDKQSKEELGLYLKRLCLYVRGELRKDTRLGKQYTFACMQLWLSEWERLEIPSAYLLEDFLEVRAMLSSELACVAELSMKID